MKKTKIKRKAVHAELRKESKTFDGWLKYEVTVKNPNGELEVIPAYGRDLQDALSRVVHDEKVQKIGPKIEKVPPAVWVILWFISIGYGTVLITENNEALGQWAGLAYLGGMALISTLFISVSNWFSLRNTKSPY